MVYVVAKLNVSTRVERVQIRTRIGQAKVIGTCVCVGGAMLLSFYHGPTIHIPASGVHLKLSEKAEAGAGGTSILGPFLIIASGVAWAFWLMVQVNLQFLLSFMFISYCVIMISDIDLEP